MATMQCRGVAGNLIMENLGDNPIVYLRGKFVTHVASALYSLKSELSLSFSAMVLFRG